MNDESARPDLSWAALALSSEITEFAGSARAHFRSLFSPDLLRELLDGASAPAQHWPALVDHGYPMVGVPEDLGGLGSLADLTVILEEAGRALLPLPLLATVVSAQTLLAAGGSLEQLGEAPAALAIAPSPGGQPRLPVFDASLAERLVVVSSGDASASVTLVEVSAAEREPEPVDAARPTAFVSFEESAIIERVDLPSHGVDDVLVPARLCVAADLIGLAALALDGAIEHAKVREQFDRPIGSFQAVKHILADTYVAIERARSLTIGGAAEFGERGMSTTARRLSLLAKAAASEVAVQAVGVQTQLLGAMGLTWESDNHLAVRRAHQTARYLGSAADLYVAAARAQDGAQ